MDGCTARLICRAHPPISGANRNDTHQIPRDLKEQTMYHLIPFAAGAVVGALAVRLLRTKTTQQGLEKAQDTLREATVSSLSSIENASARARKRLENNVQESKDDTEGGNTP
ncbi:hypothetical protein SAMN05421693_103114 [Ectothiorhodospira magna]|uniref:Uncharacterized protein n=1 Tax=Ectothiorhodospira magna TaxID=867345 RepID=A0A1H8ZY42_9GAMM|nr:hypothetical protein [Ectothiorhodospira magna]SEP69167.1 hypothetical protein SAMN05421693_103114 [Ectothiorhodospira magna]